MKYWSHWQKSSKENTKNCRPVAFFPNCGKIFKRLIFNEMFQYFSTKKPLSKNQSVLQPGDSCINQLLPTIHCFFFFFLFVFFFRRHFLWRVLMFHCVYNFITLNHNNLRKHIWIHTSKIKILSWDEVFKGLFLFFWLWDEISVQSSWYGWVHPGTEFHLSKNMYALRKISQ